MMCRTSIFALLAAAMTLAAEGEYATDLHFAVDGRIESVTLTAVESWNPNLQTYTFTRSQSGLTSLEIGTAYTTTVSSVSTGYNPKWSLETSTHSGRKEGDLVNGGTMTIPSSADYSNGYLSFYGQAKTYTVTLDSQGGSGGTPSVTATYDAAMPPATMPTREGYTFSGYYTTKIPTQGVAYYWPNGTSARTWNLDQNRTLYAYWTNNVYTVTLDKQGGSNGVASVRATYDQQMPTISVPTLTGYMFNGYYTGKNGQGTRYYTSGGSSVRPWKVASDTTLYAHWTAKESTVSLDQQSGSGGTDSVKAKYEQAMPSATMPSRTGYTFGGYYTGANGSGTQYYTAAGASARNWDKTDSAVTLYAKWTANQYTVTLDRQDGSGGTTNVTATYGQPMPSIVVPTRTGYTFGGYYTGQGGSGTQYYTDAGASARSWDIDTATPKLYAKWIGGNNLVTFYTYDGTLLNGWTTTTNYTTGVGLTLPTWEDIVLEHSSFAGWYPNDSWLGDPVESIGPAESGEKRFYAKWVDKAYNLVFDANGGQGRYTQHNVSMVDSFQLTPFTDLATNHGFTPPQGYTFSEWNTATNGTGTSFVDGEWIHDPLTNVANATVTLYAQWEPNPYQVAFNPNGADGGETMTNQWFIYDVPQPLNAVAFTYTGHAFERWSSDTNHTYHTQYYLDGAVVTNLAPGGVKNLYANWTGIVYTVSFDANGGTGTMTNMTCTYNVPTNLPYCTFERDGWGFKGWTNSLAEGVLFLDHARVTNLTTQAEEVQMYACWTGSTYSVVFDTRGEGVMTNGEGEAVSVLINSYVVGDAWDDFPVPANVDTQHWDFASWTYVDAQGVTKPIPAEVPPPSTGTTNLMATWSWKVDDLAAAVDAPELGFRTFGTVGLVGRTDESSYPANWFAQTNFVWGSTNAVQSGALPVSASGSSRFVSWLTTKVEGRGELSFWWKCDAKPVKHFLNEYGDSLRFGLYDPKIGITNEIARLTNHVDWCHVAYMNETESEVFFAWTFVYACEDSDNGGGTGWVDRVKWTPEGGGTTPRYGVPYSWLRTNFPAYESADASTLNALGDGDSPIGKPMKVGEEYWAGTDPNDPNDLFRAYIAVSNDVARITWLPDLSATGVPVRVYHVLCAPTPSAGWTVLQSNVVERLEVDLPVTDDSGTATNRFFKVELDWEESQKN